MATKAAFVRENITIDEEAMTWTCNQCFQDRMGKPGMENKPLRTYAMIGTSNIARHFDEFHKELMAEAMARIEQAKIEARLARKAGKRPPRKEGIRAIKVLKLEDQIEQDHVHVDYEWAEEEESASQTSGQAEESLNRSRVQRASGSKTQWVATPEDPLKIFFDAMYASVSKMARPDRLLIRRKLFDMVSEMEEMQNLEGHEEIIYQDQE